MLSDKGWIFTVVGLFASGKSSLINGVLQHPGNSHLVILPTYTTRLPRDSLETRGDSKEYKFVSDSEYTTKKTKSKKWNERVASGDKYGIDVAEIERQILEGVVYITTMLPDSETLREQKKVFDCPIFQVLIDVPLEVCNQRLISRDQEVADRLLLQSRLDVDICRRLVDAHFVPLGVSLNKDVSRFCVDFADFLNLGSV